MNAAVQLQRCDCEHTSHFRGIDIGVLAAHPYAAVVVETETVKTEYGKFVFCADCTRDHR